MSVNIWNEAEQKLEQVGGNVNINDSVISEDSTFSSKKINDSLVDLESALDDKQDDYTQAGTNVIGSANCNDFYDTTKTTHFFARAPINAPKQVMMGIGYGLKQYHSIKMVLLLKLLKV